MNIIQIIEAIFALCGPVSLIVSLVLYFPVKSKKIKADTESESVETLTHVVKGLRGEIASKDTREENDRKRISALEDKTDRLAEEIHILKKVRMNNEIAFASVAYCELRDTCPIIKRKNELDLLNKCL